MNQTNPYILWFEKIAKALGDDLSLFFFVGGATVSFYIDEVVVRGPRPTKDIDCVIEIVTQKQFRELENSLRQKGFVHDVTGGPVCRWLLEDVVLDVMPTDPKLLGFSNRWYAEGIRHKKIVSLPSKVAICIFSEPYFIASKFEAFFGRQEKDYRFSKDIEDIVMVLDANHDIVQKIKAAPQELTTYLRSVFDRLYKDELFEDSLLAHLGGDAVAQERAKMVVEKIELLLS